MIRYICQCCGKSVKYKKQKNRSNYCKWCKSYMSHQRNKYQLSDYEIIDKIRKLKQNNIVKTDLSVLRTKNDIYQYIQSHTKNFLTNSNLNHDDKFKKYLNDTKIINLIDLHIDDITEKKLYDHLIGPTYCKMCNKESKFKGFKYGYYIFCCDHCLFKWRSIKQNGFNNTIHKASKETLKLMGQKVSIKIKEKIKNGEFTPNITNSWCHSKVSLFHNDKIKKFRSSWEAYYYLKNSHLEYEKIRIPYIGKDGKMHSYIVDFVDKKQRILYEIKPDGKYNGEIEAIKRKYAIKWCAKNKYKYKTIGNKWFYNNYNKLLIINSNHPDKDKLLKNLSQFEHEN